MSTNELHRHPSYVTRIEIVGIYNYFDIILDDLQAGINILHGDNGSGKTTVLHVLTNALNGDYERFLNIDFNKIELTFSNQAFLRILKPEGKDIIIERSDLRRAVRIAEKLKVNDTTYREERQPGLERIQFSQLSPFPKASYFPAFRSMLEVLNLLDETKEQDSLLRKVFGNFVPSLNYFSPSQIEEKLLEEFREGKQAVINHNQEVLSKNFGNILLSFSSSNTNDSEADTQAIFKQIKQLSKVISAHPLQTNVNFIEGLEDKVDSALSFVQEKPNLSVDFSWKILKAYQDALQAIVDFQDKAFTPISNFIESFNKNIKRKRVIINPEAFTTGDDFLKLVHLDGVPFGGIQCLSSGERQIFTLMYASTHLSSQGIVLIDEPEISIHIDVQSLLLNNLSELILDKQMIVCTHSQRIAGKQRDRLKKVQLVDTDKRTWLDGSMGEIQISKEDVDEKYDLYTDVEILDEEE